MSLELISRINELVKDPQCVYQALDSILPHCHSPQNSVERQNLAIQITLCDYNAAGLVIAPQCLSHDYRDCIKALESRSQWWTSYTANYQTIGQLCIEFQPEYEAQKAAQLHRNLSRVTQTYLNSLENAYTELAAMHEKSELHSVILHDMVQSLDKIQSQVSLLTGQLGEAQESVVEAQLGLDTLKKQNSHLAFLQSQMIEHITSTGIDLEQLYDRVEHKFQSISTHLEVIAQAAFQVQELQNKTLENAMDASAITETTVQALRIHTGILIDMVSCLGGFLQIIVNFWWVFVTIVVIIILKKVFWSATHIIGTPQGPSSRHRSSLHI